MEKLLIRVNNKKKIIKKKEINDEKVSSTKKFYLMIPKLKNKKVLSNLELGDNQIDVIKKEVFTELSIYINQIKNITNSMNLKYSFFESFSNYLKINSKQLRIDAINYIVISWNRFKEYIINPFTLTSFDSKEDYLKYMNLNKSSNDYVLLFSLCELYQINATIIFNNIKDPIYIKFGSQIDILIRINI